MPGEKVFSINFVKNNKACLFVLVHNLHYTSKKLAKLSIDKKYQLYLPELPEWSIVGCLKDPASCFTSQSTLRSFKTNLLLNNLERLYLNAHLARVNHQPIQALSLLSENY